MSNLIIVIAAILLLILFHFSVISGFSFVVGLCAGSIYEKIKVNKKIISDIWD